jgi:DNA polymerase-3 subunit delta
MTQLRVDQLSAHLKQSLVPIYFIHGDEVLLVNECADAIRAVARAQGYTDRQVFTVEPGFDWQSLLAAGDSLSLFAERRIIELRLPTGKPGKEGTGILRDYAQRPPEDTLLLIISGKLEKAARRSKWVQSLDRAGVSIAVWPVDAGQLPAWIERRLGARGMRPSPEALQLIAERVEGNLLAAAQEIEKLYLLHGAGTLDADSVTGLVADSARYDVFGLVDAALAGDVAHTQRILSGLRAEGVDPVLVLWALTREIRALTTMARQLQGGSGLAQVLGAQRVWEKRKPLISSALKRIRGRQWWQLLQRCAHIDRIIKGRAAGSAWDELLQLTLTLAGAGVLKATA